MKKNYFLLAVAAVAFAACSNDESDNLEPSIISLTSNIVEAETTRANLTDAEAQNTQFVTSKSIKVEAYKTGQTTAYTTGNYTTNGSGTLTGSLYYPATDENIDICAYYPNTISSSSTSFTVDATQTTAANYQSYDLMYATKLTNKAKGSTHALTFNHALSKIIVNLQAGDGITDDNISSNVTAVKIKNTKPKAEFTITNGAVGTITASGTAADINITGATMTSSHVGIIVPQKINSGTAFIEITYNSKTYTYSLSSTTTFGAKKAYTYNIKINAVGISVSTSITDWSSQTAVNGTVTI